MADAAEQGLGEVNAIAAAVRKGEGSLGKLVADDEAYRKLISLSQRGERTLDDVEENLAALKRTWPLSRYFNDRAFFDRERVLFHPGSERDSRTLRGDDLFEPGRSVLTARGRVKLDEVGAWFKRVKRPDVRGRDRRLHRPAPRPRPRPDPDPGAGRRRPQVPGDPPRARLDRLVQQPEGRRRRVRRRGPARGGRGRREVQPPRRVEIILFTPQA